jgi:hypothetical protein
VFGKANSNAINLSTIADANNPTGGFVINGEVAKIYLHLIYHLGRHPKHPQSNHPSHRH